jgi:FMN phosphatase YigB (HAD superfamily)
MTVKKQEGVSMPREGNTFNFTYSKVLRSIRDKVILVDCDGVLLDWEYHFYKWVLETHSLEQKTNLYSVAKALDIPWKDGAKLIQIFNKSEMIRSLSPLRDAVKYVRKLHEEHGYLFHVITSQTDDQLGQAYRKENLRNVFGDVFDGFTILKTGQNKDKVLMKWEGTECYWIEDKVSNIKMGNDAGLEGILISHNWNDDCHDERKVKTWKEIYNIITGE